MTTAKYKNPWHNLNSLDPVIYSTEANPIEYRGFKIYQRIKGICFDVVKNGVCVGQYAGRTGATNLIDLINDKPKDFRAQRALGFLKAVRS